MITDLSSLEDDKPCDHKSCDHKTFDHRLVWMEASINELGICTSSRFDIHKIDSHCVQLQMVPFQVHRGAGRPAASSSSSSAKSSGTKLLATVGPAHGCHCDGGKPHRHKASTIPMSMGNHIDIY